MPRIWKNWSGLCHACSVQSRREREEPYPCSRPRQGPGQAQAGAWHRRVAARGVRTCVSTPARKASPRGPNGAHLELLRKYDSAVWDTVSYQGPREHGVTRSFEFAAWFTSERDIYCMAGGTS
eukprot:363330-Chlamydomonas_euryale.AAC.20